VNAGHTVQRQPAGVIQRELDRATLDIAALCHQLYEAMDGAGTDEEAVYSALRRGAAFDVAKARELRTAYQQITGQDLMVDLEDDLNRGELAAALIYLGYMPATTASLGDFQRERARHAMLRMSGTELSSYTGLLIETQSTGELQYLHKALAAGHTVAEIRTFAGQIRGHDANWFQDNLHVTGSTTGRGIQQQWSHSCNITTVEAMRGEMDPIYALQLHIDNPSLNSPANAADATAVNPTLAAEQRTLLERDYTGGLGNMSGGVAVARGATGGVGRWADDLLNQQAGATGVRYRTRRLGAGEITLDEALTAINRGVDRGIPVPIVIGDTTSTYAHYVMVLSRSGNNYRIHDPWDGVTVTRTRDNITGSTINLAGGWNVLSAVEIPRER
jgi:hypothetical protein